MPKGSCQKVYNAEGKMSKKMEPDHIETKIVQLMPTEEQAKRVSPEKVDLSVLDGATIESYSVHPAFDRLNGIHTIRITKNGKSYLLYPECKVLEVDTSVAGMKLIMGISIERRLD